MTEENVKTVNLPRPDLTGLPGMLSEGIKTALAEWYEKSIVGTADYNVDKGEEAYLCCYIDDKLNTCARRMFQRVLGQLYHSISFQFTPWSTTPCMEGCTNPERFRFVSYAIGVPYPEQSLELTRFYRGLEDRIEAGDMPVNICAELHEGVRVPGPVYSEAKRELNGVQLVPELRLYPFNSSEDEYDEELETDTFYQNPARCRWIHEHTNRPGVVLGGELPDFYPCVQTKKVQMLAIYGMGEEQLRLEYPRCYGPTWEQLRNAGPRHGLWTRPYHYQNAKNPSWKLPAAVTTLGLLGTALALLLGGCL